MQKIIYLYPDNASFVKKDVGIFSKHFKVLTKEWNWKKKSRIPLNLLLESIFLIMHTGKCRAIFVMFGGYWSFMPALLGRIFHKPVFIILGGTDCVSFPEYNYGSLRKPFLRKIIGWSYKLADRLLPVDSSLISNDYEYDPAVKENKQGYLNFFPSLSTPNTIVHNGFDPKSLSAEGIIKEEKSFITVAKVDDMTRMNIKGIDMVIGLARRIPDHTFIIIGMDKNFTSTLGSLPENIIIHAFLNFDELKSMLQKSRYYLQLSISEGFPNALCEGMLCECIPIGSRVGAIPYIIQDDRLVVEKKDICEIEKKLREIISLSFADKVILGEKARKRILDNFTIEAREKVLMSIMMQYGCFNSGNKK